MLRPRSLALLRTAPLRAVPCAGRRQALSTQPSDQKILKLIRELNPDLDDASKALGIQKWRELQEALDGKQAQSGVPGEEEMVRMLQLNPELDEADARTELRWMKQEAKWLPFSQSKGEGSGPIRVAEMVKRRAAGEPLQYILGTVDFGPIRIQCKPPTLIPRPETAEVVLRLAEMLGRATETCSFPCHVKIVDLCTGSGCIALLLHHWQMSHTHFRHHVSGVDISDEALELARENAKHLQVYDSFTPVRFFQRDIWKPWNLKRFHVVVSNPPYIPKKQWDGLSDSVKKHEAPLALIGDPQDVPFAHRLGSDVPMTKPDGRGLSYYRRIALLLPDILLPRDDHSGWDEIPKVAVEVGQGQAEAVKQIFMTESKGEITSTQVWKDSAGIPRMVVGF